MNHKLIFHHAFIAAAILFNGSLTLSQESSYQNAYVSAVEGDASLQRATEPEPQLGEINAPVLPGDRLWTGAGSRVEVRFADGTLLRLDEYTKVDFIAFGSEPTVLVWSGSVILKAGAESADVRIDSPAGSVYPQAAGTYRVDAHEGSMTTLSVTEGVAELASSEGSVLVGGGQRSLIESGRRPETAFEIDTARWDAFDTWSAERDRSVPRLREVPLAEVPGEVHNYVDELSEYGDWREDEEYGSVWYPSVSVGWAPYRQGHWAYTYYGYTWVSYEPWGWAPYHYGRWGYNHLGWYWVPGSYWGPAWVSFAIGPVWIGWSPLGYHGRPVFAYDSLYYGHNGRYRLGRHYRGGKAVPRHVYDHDAGWNFVHSQQFGKRTRHTRLRAADVQSTFARAKVHTGGAVLDRNLTPHALATAGSRRETAQRRDGQHAGGSRSLAQTRPRTSSPSSSLQRAREIVGRTDTFNVRRRSGEQSGASSQSTSADPTRARRRDVPIFRSNPSNTRSYVRQESARTRTGGRDGRGSSSDTDSNTNTTRQRDRSNIFRAPRGSDSSASRGYVRQDNGRTRPTPTPERSRGNDRATSRTRTRGDAFFGSSSRRESVTRPQRSGPSRQRSTTRSSRTPTRQQSPSMNRSTPNRQRGSSSGVRGTRGRSQPSSGGSRGSRGGGRSRGSGRSRSN